MTIVGDNAGVLRTVEYAWIAKKSGVYPYGITGTIANGGDAGMARAKGFTSLVESVPAGAQNTAIGDGRIIDVYRQRPQEAPSATLGFIVFDHSIVTALSGTTVYTDGEYDISWRSQQCTSIANCVLVLNVRMKSQDSGAVGLPGWATIIYPDVELTQEGETYSGENADAVLYNFAVTMNHVDTTPWGELLATNYSQTYGFSTRPIVADYPITLHTIVGDNATVDFTVDETPTAASSNAVPVWTAGVKKTYTTDYTVVTATKTITFEAAAKPGAGVVAISAYQFEPDC